MTIRNSQFPRHGGDREQRRQAFYPLLPMEMSHDGPAGILELITRHLPVFFRHSHRNPQLQRGGFGRKARFQFPYFFQPALDA
jgi:hypothetical protein